MQTATPASAPRTYGRGETFIRWALRVPEHPREKVSPAEAERSFSFAMLISATRCIVGYGIAPVALPILGLAPGIEPWIDIPIGLVALVFDVRSIRRFWVSDHRHRKGATVIYAVVMTFVLVLLVKDILTLIG